eukprot:scpid10263/ scgid8766/ 
MGKTRNMFTDKEVPRFESEHQWQTEFTQRLRKFLKRSGPLAFYCSLAVVGLCGPRVVSNMMVYFGRSAGYSEDLLQQYKHRNVLSGEDAILSKKNREDIVDKADELMRYASRKKRSDNGAEKAEKGP